MRTAILGLCAVLVFVTAGRVYAQTWVQKIAGPGLGNPLTVNPLNSDILYGAAGSDRVYISRDRGYSWANFGALVTGGGIIKSLSVSPLDTNHILAGIESAGGNPDRVMKSTNGGFTWDTTWTGTFSYFGQPVEFSPLHPDTVYTMGLDTLFRSIDFGSTWDTVASDRGFNAWCDAAIRPDSAAVIYLGDNLSGIWKTEDHGSSWRKVYSTLGEIPSIAIDPFDPSVAYAGKFGGGGGLIKTTDWGETWHNVIVPSGNRDTWWVVCSPEHPGYVYYGTYTGDTARLGIYISRDSASTWTKINDGLPQSAIFNYGLLTLDSLTLIALQGSGIFKFQYPTTIGVTAPAGGDYWLADSQYTITWTATGVYYVRIEFSLDGGNSWTELADSIPAGQGSFGWTTPSLLSDSCLVRISDALWTSTTDVSDSLFTITNAELTIDSPNGGEVWDAGSVQEIRWSSVSFDSVQVEYSADSGAGWNLITRIPADVGTFEWTIPKNPTTVALVRMQGVDDTNVVDVSDGVFTIRYINTFTGDILVADNGAESDTLTFGMVADATDGIDTLLGEAELPVTPGPGSFDARWALAGSGGVSTDFRDTLHGDDDAHVFTLAFQPGGGGYPLTFSWDPESLRAGAFILRDPDGPGTKVNLNMRQDSSLVISDTSLHELEILLCTGAEITIPGDGGWILTSLPLETGDHRASSNFPFSTSGAFEYRNGYIRRDTLVPGRGYWIKSQQVILQGCPILSETVAVRPGWNILGAPTKSMAVADIVSVPETLIVSPFYGYGSGGYLLADSIHAGEGYWVKCRDSGTIIMDQTVIQGISARNVPSLPGRLNTLRMTGGEGGVHSGVPSTLFFGPDSTPGWLEAPPEAPGRVPSARFENGKIGILHDLYPKYPIEYKIRVNTPETEIFFSWDVEIGDIFNYILVESNGTREVSATPLRGSGSASFTRSPGSLYFLRVHLLDSGGGGLPRDYSMGRFYPNPFNPSTRVSFQLPFESIISYNICNLLGETVVSSDERNLTAGEYGISWDGMSDDGNMVGSGVYFLTFTAKSTVGGSSAEAVGYRAVRKLLLLR